MQMPYAMALLGTLGLGACQGPRLQTQHPTLEIVPLPSGNQAALSGPTGIDLGAVPLYGRGYALFRLDNTSPFELTISTAILRDVTGGSGAILSYPQRIAAQSSGELVVAFSPAEDSGPGSLSVALATDTGASGDAEALVRVIGTGLFVGEPNLQVCYGGACHDLPEACDTMSGACVLPALDFGNVELGTLATELIRLANRPTAGTCLPPSGAPSCTAACVVTFLADASHYALGVGLVEPKSGFAIDGTIVLPFFLGSDEPACDDAADVRRREVPLVVSFAAGTSENLHLASKMILESNQPGARVVEIPLLAAARKAPVAVAKLRSCDASPTACTAKAEQKPLARVYFDGSQSFDPDGLALTRYSWRVIEAPVGADQEALEPLGVDTPYFSIRLPIAGRYVARLEVENDLGVTSGTSPTSDIIVTAVPESRLHVELTWDNPENDHDLHVVNADLGDLVFKNDTDCYWKTCSPTDPRTQNPVHWVASAPLYAGPNPRLDIDDTEGFGPENVNVDLPSPGHYRIYVHYYIYTHPDVVDRTQARVRIYLDRVLRAEYHRLLDGNDLWRVAEVEWTLDGAAIVRPATSDAEGEIGAVRRLEGISFETGYAFGDEF